ncbi:hypothetical protein ASPCAL13248 [Aspergillus calidoustus]|uniref:C2H2-type domain-containing protein n=1 Tax=Aspergillus calidoustus TaxID=454130 RepID=A0A0U5GE43_ASPCI|nr:hypothetical protein ASPCAL13248 [Aspergillus calidoustus]
MELGPNGLLWYDAKYSILICRECQYAIQKNAIQSHLLRHKIYRDERRNLLAAIAELDIVEPNDISVPPPGLSPIESLPIASGYRCLVAGCGHLCASSKRMKSHQSESHGQAYLSDFDLLAQEVKLQTFFRGNKLRYFEVTPQPTRAGPTVTSNQREKGTQSKQGNSPDLAVDGKEQVGQPRGSQALTPDLEMLRYFHHFTTEAILTLPSNHDFAGSESYWTGIIVPLALQHQYLMSGLIAISAAHMATLQQPFSSSHGHRRRSAEFAVQFFDTWKRSSKDASMSTDVVKAGTQIACILNCACWVSRELALDGSEPKSSELESILATMREYGFGSTSSQTSSQGRTRGLGDSSPSRPRNSGMPSPNAERLIQLYDLPLSLADALGKPENVHDVLVTLEAISTLIECYGKGCPSNTLDVTWQSMTAWPARIPEHFHKLVTGNRTPALIVLAHWAAFLVKPVEEHGWFLDGAAEKMLRLIREQLVQNHDGPEILCLLP